MVTIENHNHMLEITYKIAILWVFKTILALLWVLHETWHTTLYSRYYCIKAVRIENPSHVPEITY